MAETIESLPNVTLKQSIARIELFTDAALPSDDWRLVIHFEDGLYDAAGKLLQPTQFGTRMVTRRFGDIRTDSAAPGISVAQLAAMIQSRAYAYRTQDIAAAQPPQPTEGPGDNA